MAALTMAVVCGIDHRNDGFMHACEATWAATDHQHASTENGITSTAETSDEGTETCQFH